MIHRNRPILFSAPMVRAILDGRKTQTRRIVTPQPAGAWAAPGRRSCPFGVPGDRLWVRETWGYFGGDEYLYQKERGSVGYRADHLGFEPIPGGRWRPSIHMPRWASRITLEIADVRVERLQEISEADAKAEGCAPVTHADGAVDCGTRKTTFRALWESIHGPGSWDTSPWVWAITFRRMA